MYKSHTLYTQVPLWKVNMVANRVIWETARVITAESSKTYRSMEVLYTADYGHQIFTHDYCNLCQKVQPLLLHITTAARAGVILNVSSLSDEDQ